MGHFTCFSVLRSAPSILHCDNDVGGEKVKEEEVQSIEKKTGGCPYVLSIIVIGSLFFWCSAMVFPLRQPALFAHNDLTVASIVQLSKEETKRWPEC